MDKRLLFLPYAPAIKNNMDIWDGYHQTQMFHHSSQPTPDYQYTLNENADTSDKVLR